MDIIQLLPDNIANQIAAGEVVQRPASVVKELLENSVDAGSRTIKLIVKNAGKTLIQVIDDGSGMSETDARMCFERHATSKIKNLDDLYQIHTLGFRGEAMASIAAVAQVELRTKTKIDAIGSCLFTENSEVKSQEPCAAPDGTSISVKNLFYNVPARRNFLKSNPVELRHINDEFLRVALANPEIHFVFINENEEVYHLRSGNLKQRIISIWGKKYDEALVPVEETTDILTIKGFIGKPEWARKTRGEQFFFANNRFIKNAYLNHAVATAYEQLLPSDSFPFYIIFLELSPSRIDINVHPTKTEIKFEDEKAIYAMLRSAVKKSLSQYHIAPSLNFDDELNIHKAYTPTPQIPERSIETNNYPSQSSTASGYQRNTYRENDFYRDQTRQTKVSPDQWQELYSILSAAHPEEEKYTEKQEDLIEIQEESTHKGVLQLHQKFIISSIRSGLIIINQQLAHERILYEKYLEGLDKAKTFSQRLLFPEIVQLQTADYNIAIEILEDIRNLGFDIEDFGKNSFIINGLPVDLKEINQKNILEKIIEDYKNNLQVEKLERRENLARAMARNASIKMGKSLKYEEMTRLIDELFACKLPYFSPDGKPTLITISTDELDKKFKS